MENAQLWHLGLVNNDLTIGDQMNITERHSVVSRSPCTTAVDLSSMRPKLRKTIQLCSLARRKLLEALPGIADRVFARFQRRGFVVVALLPWLNDRKLGGGIR